MGRDVRLVRWTLRHPLFVAVPAALITGWAYLGLVALAVSVGGLALGITVWSRVHPATFDQLAAPRLRAAWRRWVTYRGGRWARVLTDCELVRQHPLTQEPVVPRVVRVKSPTPSIDTVTVELARGQSEKPWVDQSPVLAHGLRVERVAVSKHRPGRITMTVERSNPFKYAIPAPVIPASVDEVDLTRLPCGFDERGELVTMAAIGASAHTLGAGATGSGKSSMVWCPLRSAGPMIREGLLRVRMLDLKGGMESEPAAPLFYRHGSTAEDALRIVTEFRDDMRARQAELKGRGERQATVSIETPAELLIIDEVAMLTAYAESRKLLQDLVRLLSETMTQGRATGHTVWAFLQEPLKDILPLRDLFVSRLCLAVAASSHVDGALGEDMRERGAAADEIPLDDPEFTGVGFRVDKRLRQVRRIRLGYATDADIAELVDTCSPPPSGPTLSVLPGVA